jgi:glycosyltransferase involved in cell wall biosynthesis
VIFDLWIIGSAIGLLLISIKQISFAKHIQRLTDVVIPERTQWPKISLIVPACNEESTIELALQSLLNIQYPNLEIIIVNDRSTDKTGTIIERVCKGNSRAQIVTLHTLPEGWIGKVHAQYQAMKYVSGDWILFTDADVHFAQDALKKAVTYCEDRNVDFLTLIPDIIANGFGIKACITQFLATGSLAVDMLKIRNPNSRDAIGCGAFNFVKRTAYNRTHGLEWLKMEVIDDGAFGFMMKSSEAKCDLVSGLNEVQIEWYPNVRSYVRGLEKNAFSIFQYNIVILTVFTFFMCHWMAGLYVIPFIQSDYAALLVLLISFLIYHFSNHMMMKKASNFPAYVILWLPFAKLLSLFTVWRGAILCIFRGGIYWRETFYSIKELKANQRLKLMNFIFLKKYD